MTMFSEKLRHLREREYPTPSIRTNAELMGFSRETLRRYESGEREPKWSEVEKICEFYGVTPDFFTRARAEKNLQFGTVWLHCQ